MELPCIALYHRRDHSTALFSASKEKLIVDEDTDKLLRNKTICPTARGLLLVHDPDTLATFLWSPQDGEQLHLPPLQGLEDGVLMHSHCLLSEEPSAPGCVVLLVDGGDNTFMWYCHPGDDVWVKHDYDIGTQILPHLGEEQYEKSTICPVVACRGKFYFNGSPTELGVLEFSPNPVISFIVIDDNDSSEGTDESDSDSEDEGSEGSDESDSEGHTDGEFEDDEEPAAAVFLVESGDELYKVSLLYVTQCGHEIDDAFVDRWDFSELRWRAMDDLGGRTFLLSLFYFGASCSGAEHGLQQDCVYIVYPRKKEMQI